MVYCQCSIGIISSRDGLCEKLPLVLRQCQTDTYNVLNNINNNNI